jgi:hypothetical protein
VLSPRFAQRNKKKTIAEREPWAEETPYPWKKYRFREVHGTASFLHFNIFLGGMGE